MKSLRSYIDQGRFYKTVVDDGSDLIFVVDYHGKILYHNSSVQDLGHRPGSLAGKSLFDFIEKSTVPAVQKAFEKCSRKAYSEALEFEWITKSGDVRFFEYHAINLKKREGLKGLILDCRDITQRKKIAEELIQAQKAKDLFLANISHELRTPINGIVGMTTLLGQEIDPREQLTYLTAIRTAAENLKVIINDILDLASIDSGKVQFELVSFRMRELLETLIHTYQVQAREKGIDLRLELSPDVDKYFQGDPVRVNQILTNLVSNALKFTKHGHIVIRCTLEKKSGNTHHLRFEVVDTGIGIHPEKLDDIFESFTQADASITRQYGGTGLGLTIARQLVKIQRGKISVSSQLHAGSTFTVVLPFPVARAPRKSTKLSPAPIQVTEAFTPLSVLLVEDNEINRLYATALLKKWNCPVDVAEHGQMAIDMLGKKSYDLVLMDVQMPIMDGYEATKIIRRGPAPTNKIPIIALTANASPKDTARCLEAGMNECISKPFTPEQLLTRLQKFKKGASSLSSHSKSIDLKYLLDASRQDDEFVKTMVRAMIASFPGSISAIQQNLEEKNWVHLAEAVHRMKSSLSMIGMEESRKNASLIEELIDTQKISRVPALVIELCKQMEKALEELRAFDAQR